MKINVSLPRFAAFLGFLYLYISINPFPMWILPSLLITIVLSVAILSVTYVLYVRKILVFTYRRFILVLLLMMLSIHLSAPLFGHSLNTFKIVHFFPLLLIAFYPKSIHYHIFKYFRWLIILVSGLGIAVFLILFIGIDLPYYRVDGFTVPMMRENDYYRVYGLVVSSTNTVYEIFGFHFARVCGPFLEPGHFAIYLSIVLCVEKAIYNKLSILPVIAGILTFSPAFLIVFTIIIGYELLIQKKIKLLIITSFVTLSAFLFIITDPVVQEWLYYFSIGRNLASEEQSILDARTAGSLLYEYNRFLASNDIFFGRGLDSMRDIGLMSDYRGLLFKMGIYGLIITIVAFGVIFWSSKMAILFLLVPVVVLIFAHRAWMFESPYIYMLMIVAVSTYNLKHQIPFLNLFSGKVLLGKEKVEKLNSGDDNEYK